MSAWIANPLDLIMGSIAEREIVFHNERDLSTYLDVG